MDDGLGKATKKELERRVFDLRNLLEISKSLSSTLDYGILNDSILYTCLGALTVVRAAFFSKKTIDATDFTLHRSFLGFDLEEHRSYSIPQLCPLVDYLNEHTHCHDPGDLFRVVKASPELRLLADLEAHMVVPLKAKGTINGLLVLGGKIGGEPFDDRDRAYLDDIAGLAAIAIHNAYLYELTTTDLMTKLKLKHFFLNSLHEKLGDQGSEPLSVVMLDIDYFKRVNDGYGHLTGDVTLKAVAALLLDSVRQADVAARYGGEEFVLLLPETDLDHAREVAERIRHRVESTAMPTEAGPTHRVTVSAGVAQYDPVNDRSPEALLERADRALYRSKDEGRNRVTVALPVENTYS